MHRPLFAAFAVGLAATAGSAQEQTVLVLDASGSMWGQIEGTAKITIAQGVLGEWLDAWPEDRLPGLAAYGHRERGDCADIEVLVAPGEDTGTDIREALAALRPTGSTPMSDALRIAAEEMRYTEEPATVILVSDGIETCAPDPCAAALALEETGADFTAHVIALDVADAEASAQMQCMAEATGGAFHAAADAPGLADALSALTSGAEMALSDITFRAIQGRDGSEITEPLLWKIRREGTPVSEPDAATTMTMPLGPGDYEVTVTRPGSEEGTATTFTVSDQAQIVTVRLPDPAPGATLDGPGSAPIGVTVEIEWAGPGKETDYVSVARPDATGYETYTYVRDGSPLSLRMPATPGTYELRYIRSSDDAVLATRPITATEVEVELEIDTEVDMGASVPLVWLGPGYDGDYISVSRPGDDGHVNYTYTREGSPLRLLMPPEPGSYQVRYVMALDATVLETLDIEVLPVEAKLYAEARAKAGAELEVDWDGPDYENDYISIAEPGSGDYETYTYTREGGPLTVTAPLEPGEYELRYVLNQDDTVLAAQPLEVVDVSASLQAPETARAGAPVVVTWEGPAYPKDFLTIAQVDDPGYAGFRYARDGNPLILDMPSAPGEYEIRYVAASVGETVLARRAITLEPVDASITGPESAPVGGNIAFSWEGPDYRRDYVALAPAGSEDGEVLASVYTSDDSPSLLVAPDQPGDYELRYHLGRDGTVLARHPISVTE
ncbi:hypothetical protein OCH239_10285 [Roseivivax halodurans JCM 10272]|uniref:VWFA domain-containing protein n=1 Tax=Roseivivax halodurans JCM 10272 TaxID=1449350 RepID=X7EE26_9RHOB|nr:VWA domain-containing protein [Roseivivax halodurans]ETX13426.1 hypothetical protein OCH239_10285 [Roseivivax halodurans JCM 10272]